MEVEPEEPQYIFKFEIQKQPPESNTEGEELLEAKRPKA
jgi:hypothetical protein